MESARSSELAMMRDTGMVHFARGITAGQNAIVFDASPVIHKFPVPAMAAANVLPFRGIITVGPPRVATPCDPRLLVYANFISEDSPDEMAKRVQEMVRSACETLIASAAGTITMKDVKSPHFKDTIIKMVEPQLSQFGLMVYNLGFDVALDHAYFSNLVSNTHPVIFAKQLKLSDFNQLSLPKKVFDHLLETSRATFNPGVGLTFVEGHHGSEDHYTLNFNVADDWEIIRELTCRVRKTGYSKPEVISNSWKQFVHDWNLEQGDFIIFYELVGHFTGVKYKIGVVRDTRPY